MELMQTNLYLSFCKVAKIASFHVDAKIPELMCFNLSVKKCAYLNFVFRRILMEMLSVGSSWLKYIFAQFSANVLANSAKIPQNDYCGSNQKLEVQKMRNFSIPQWKPQVGEVNGNSEMSIDISIHV